MSEAVIQVDRLTKHYGPVKAVRDISFNVAPGEVVGFLGPNGAGKSTTMKILTCYMGPTSGSVRIAGLDLLEKGLEARKKVGYLPESNALYYDMTALEYLRFIAAIRRIPSDKLRSRLVDITQMCGLSEVLGKSVDELSKGFKQRLGLAQAMLHDPDILIMDEPTSGLDPNQIIEVRKLIRDIGARKTVILSTHILPEVQATCDRAIIISQGKIVADGRLEDLKRQRGNRYHMLVEGPNLEEAQTQARGVQGVADVKASQQNGSVSLDVLGTDDADLRKSLFRLAVDRGWMLLEQRRDSASLEDVFRNLTQE